ncbi:hypothetical protein E2542_SST04414 [Spatholobus suberectus]|nr:hypothetical protein E2542_SST04414 [Spatholobus suberectus]
MSIYFYYGAIFDTCMAMGEWVANPHTESALSNVLPCVDQRTTNKTLFQSKQVVTNIASVVNRFIYNTANINVTQASFGYYNQSAPNMPSLCCPFDSQLQKRQCTDQEVSSANVSMRNVSSFKLLVLTPLLNAESDKQDNQGQNVENVTTE